MKVPIFVTICTQFGTKNLVQPAFRTFVPGFSKNLGLRHLYQGYQVPQVPRFSTILGYGRSVADVTGVNAGIGAVPGQMGPIVSNFQSRHASEVPLPITNGNQFRPSSTLTNSGMELPIDIERTETTGLKYAINMKTRSSTPPNNNLKEVSRAKQVGMGAQLGQGQNLTHPNVAPQTNLNGTVYEAPSASKPSDFDQILQTKIQKITILNDRIKRQKKSSKKLLKKTKKQSRVIDAYKRYCKRHGLNGRYEIGDFVSGESESESSDTISVE